MYKDNPFECPEIIAAVALILIFILIITIVIVVCCCMRKNKHTEKEAADPESEVHEKCNNAGVIPSRYLHSPEDESYEVNDITVHSFKSVA